ncbi:MAG: hypothetical protein ACKVG7_02170 [Flavobacteriales bacterium]
MNKTLLLIICILFGCKHGIKEEINAEGDTCFTNYEWGDKEGSSHCFYFNRVKKSESWYYDNKLTSIKNYDANGLLSSYAKYKNGKIMLTESYWNGNNLNLLEKRVWDYKKNTINEIRYFSNFRKSLTGTWSIDPYEDIGIWNYYWESGLRRMTITNKPRDSNGVKRSIYRCWTSQGEEIPDCVFLDPRLK